MNLLRTAGACGVMFLATLGALTFANAGTLDDFGRGYSEGTFLPSDQKPDYEWLYGTTKERSVTFGPQVVDRDAIVTTYEAKWANLDGTQQVERGVAAFYMRDGAVYYVEKGALEGVDLAFAGQVADIGTTAAGLAAGFAEANPLVAGAIGSPAGALAVIGLKLWLAKSMDDDSLLTCIGGKMAVSQMGWSLSAWNLGALLIHPAAGLLGAAIAYIYADDRPAAFRACALAKLKATGKTDVAAAQPEGPVLIGGLHPARDAM